MDAGREENTIVHAHAVIFDGKGGGKLMDEAEAVSLNDKECCFWQNLDYKNPETYKLLVDGYGFDATIAEALCDEETRPRYFKTGDGIVIILRSLNMNRNSDIDDMISLRIWIDEKKIITLSHRRILALSEILELLMKKNGPKSTAECFVDIADRLVNGISETAEDISGKTDDLEEKVIDMDNLSDFELRAQLSALRREIIAIRRYANPQKDIFQYLQNDATIFKSPKLHSEFREIYNSLTKAIEDLDYSKDHLSVFHEELQSKTSISMSRIMYMISIVTVIFMPLGLITSLLGINVAGIPYAAKEWAFGAVCLLLLLICVILITLMKKLRWL